MTATSIGIYVDMYVVALEDLGEFVRVRLQHTPEKRDPHVCFCLPRDARELPELGDRFDCSIMSDDEGDFVVEFRPEDWEEGNAP